MKFGFTIALNLIRGLTAVLFAVALARTSVAVEFYVSPEGDDRNEGSSARPVKTLQRALELTRTIEREENKDIVMKDGLYPFDRPVVFRADDYDVTVRAEHSRKAVLSGSVKLSGWKKDDLDERFLVAELPFDSEEGANYMMTCGGADCQIAAYPEKGRMPCKGGADAALIGYDKSDFPAGADLDALDLVSVWLELPQEYTTTVTSIKNIDTTGCTIELVAKVGLSLKKFNRGFRMYNCRFGMTRPGMWMYEAKARRVLYWPKKGETAENIDCRITRAGAILVSAHSSGVTFRGLVVEGCTKTLDKNKANPYGVMPTLAAIFIGMGSRNVIIDDCEVRNCAGAGIYATKPEHCVVKNSHVHDVGMDGIDFFDGGNASDILNCEVNDYGKGAVSARGILMQLSNVKCIGNHVHHGPGNGVVMWSSNSVFASNEVHHVMLQQRDGGGLYSGLMDCVLKDNYIHHIGWPGLYIDEGSRHVLYTGNRFERCWWPIHVHCAQNVIVSNNVFKNDSHMRWSFQGSGHCIFSDNKIYTREKPTGDRYLDNCDFWGRNEFFLSRDDGSYASAGFLTLERKPLKPFAFDLPALTANALRPIDARGRVERDAYVEGMSWSGWAVVGADGYAAMGVPDANVLMCYDDYYLYVKVVRRWNALCSYPGMQNLTSTGWGHCDGARISFENGRTLTVFPNGKFEVTGFKPRIEKDDLAIRPGGSIVVRLALEDLAIRNAKAQQVRLGFETADDGLLLTEEAVESVRKDEKMLPKPIDVIGCSLKFNVTIWVEDMREEKSLFPRTGNDYATGTVRFTKAPEGKR